MQASAEGLSSIVVAVYLAAVVFNGNLDKLISEVTTEYQFLEFFAAAIVLGFLATNKVTGEIAAPIIAVGTLAVILRAATNTNTGPIMSDFAAGKAGLFQTVGRLIAG